MSGAAFAAGALAVIAAADLSAGLPGLAPRVIGGVRAGADALSKAGNEGRDPGAAERRRLLAGGALAAFAAGVFLAGPLAGIVAAAAGPSIAARMLRARRDRYRAAVDDAAAEICVVLADALGGGHSLRGALIRSAGGLGGPAGHELRRVAAELDIGAPTADALEGLRSRIRSPRMDAIVSGALMQRGAGGDLAGLLRGCARSFEEESRLMDEVKAATAQARFTGLVVALLPLGGALMAELGSPGFMLRLISSPLSAWLVGMAVAMQVGAAWAIRRIADIGD